MPESAPPPPQNTPARPKRCWPGRLLIAFLVLIVFPLLVLAGIFFCNRHRALAEAIAETDRLDPGWELGTTPRGDVYGDPLPKEAIARLGTIRLRVGGNIHSLAYSPDGQFLVSGSIDNTTRLWEVATGKELRQFGGHDPWVTSVAFAPDGKTVASAGAPGYIRISDAKTGNEVSKLRGHSECVSSLSYSPDGKILASGSGINGGDCTLRLWNVATGRELYSFKHKEQVISVAFAPDGRSVASSCHDCVVRIWEVATGKERMQFKIDGFWRDIGKVAFSLNSRLVAVGGRDLTILDTVTGKQEQKMMGGTILPLFLKDGTTIAVSVNGHVVLLDLSTGKGLRSFGYGITSLALSPDGKTLAGGSGTAIHFWQVADGKEINPTDSHISALLGVVFSPDGKQVITGGFDGTTRLWDAESGRAIRKLESYRWGHWYSADGKREFVTTSDGQIRVLDTATEKEIARLTAKPSSVQAVSSDGQLLLYSRNTVTDRTLYLWSVAEQKVIQQFVPENADEDNMNDTRCSRFSPDNKLLILPNSRSSVSIWDVATSKLVQKFPEQPHEIFCVALSPNGKLLALGNWDKTVRIHDVKTAKEVMHLIGHQGHINAMAFSPDGNRLATASSDGSALIWSVNARN